MTAAPAPPGNPSAPVPPVELRCDPDEVGERLGGDRVAVPPSVLDRIAASGAEVVSGPETRTEAGRDWWPLAIGWALECRVPARPDAVVRPRTTAQVSAVLAACSAAGVPVTPAGGRSGVCGGSVPVFGGVTLDCTGLVGGLAVDETSLLADVPAGMFGPDLEEALRATGPGYTLGHRPQSMDLSTVGGWLACRSAGQYSTRYGKIEDMVTGLEVVLADGRVLATEGRAPRAATGPRLTDVFVGSEGVLGVITAARLRVHPLPAAGGRRVFGFDRFAQGLDACRRVLRRGATPAVLRLYDHAESARSFDVADTCLLVVVDEADPALLGATMAVVDEECADARRLDDGLAERWLAERNDVSALAALWQAGVVVDTAEVAGRWSVLPALAEEMVAALRQVPGTLGASVHQSHAYADGACLYFTFAGACPPGTELPGTEPAGAELPGAAPPGAELPGAASGAELPGAASGAAPPGETSSSWWQERYYVRAWDTLTAAAARRGAALSHHHGVGLNRSRFAAAALGEGHAVLAALKRTLDPAGILNPGKLGLPSPFGEVRWP